MGNSLYPPFALSPQGWVPPQSLREMGWRSGNEGAVEETGRHGFHRHGEEAGDAISVFKCG